MRHLPFLPPKHVWHEGIRGGSVVGTPGIRCCILCMRGRSPCIGAKFQWAGLHWGSAKSAYPLCRAESCAKFWQSFARRRSFGNSAIEWRSRCLGCEVISLHSDSPFWWSSRRRVSPPTEEIPTSATCRGPWGGLQWILIRKSRGKVLV